MANELQFNADEHSWIAKWQKGDGTIHDVNQKELYFAPVTSSDVFNIWVQAEQYYEYTALEEYGTGSGEYDTEYVDEGLVKITISEVSGKYYVRALMAQVFAAYHVTEPVTISVNNQKVELLPTIRPRYGKNGALSGLIVRAPYDLPVDQTIEKLEENGILIPADNTDYKFGLIYIYEPEEDEGGGPV